PIILHEQPNRGQTIIEKLERESAPARFAIVILSPDDWASPDGGSTATKRARQNVVFEWGLFVALIGRANVAALKVGDVELPSDLHGVLWHRKVSGWETVVAKEMRAAGLMVDLNRL